MQWTDVRAVFNPLLTLSATYCVLGEFAAVDRRVDRVRSTHRSRTPCTDATRDMVTVYRKTCCWTSVLGDILLHECVLLRYIWPDWTTAGLENLSSTTIISSGKLSSWSFPIPRSRKSFWRIGLDSWAGVGLVPVQSEQYLSAPV